MRMATIRSGLLALALLGCAASDVGAQAASQPAPSERAEAAAKPAANDNGAVTKGTGQEAEVTLANRTVTVLRGTFYGVDPEGRARRAELALRDLAAQGGEGKVTVRAEPQGHAVLIDGQLALLMIAEDADRVTGQTLGQASAAARSALELSLNETREGRQVQRLLHEGLISLLATLVAAVIVLLARWLRDGLSRRLERSIARDRTSLRVGGVPILHPDRLVDVARIFVRGLYWVVVLIVVYQWLGFVLSQFPYTLPWGESLTRFLIGIVAHLGNQVLKALPDLTVAVAIFLLARGVIALSRPIFARVTTTDSRSGSWLNADTVRPTEKLFRLGVVLFALVMAYPYLPGSGSEAFKGVSVLLGLMLTLGGSSVVGQSVSGLVLMYSRTLRVGEYVRIDEHEGTVTHLGTFTTRLRTGMGEELTLPNTLVLGTVTKNYSRTAQGAGFVLDTAVTIGYDTPWRQVEAMLTEAARRTPGVVADPPPRVFQTALTDFYPEYRLVCQSSPTGHDQRAVVMSTLHAHIQDVFNEHGVQIMSPHYFGDPAQAKVVARADWYRQPARPPDENESA
jgi:small-conductance mechanosensitive channel